MAATTGDRDQETAGMCQSPASACPPHRVCAPNPMVTTADDRREGHHRALKTRIDLPQYPRRPATHHHTLTFADYWKNHVEQKITSNRESRRTGEDPRWETGYPLLQVYELTWMRSLVMATWLLLVLPTQSVVAVKEQYLKIRRICVLFAWTSLAESVKSGEKPYSLDASTIAFEDGESRFTDRMRSSLFPEIKVELDARVHEDGVVRVRMEREGLKKRYDETASGFCSRNPFRRLRRGGVWEEGAFPGNSDFQEMIRWIRTISPNSKLSPEAPLPASRQVRMVSVSA